MLARSSGIDDGAPPEISRGCTWHYLRLCHDARCVVHGPKTSIGPLASYSSACRPVFWNFGDRTAKIGWSIGRGQHGMWNNPGLLWVSHIGLLLWQPPGGATLATLSARLLLARIAFRQQSRLGWTSCGRRRCAAFLGALPALFAVVWVVSLLGSLAADATGLCNALAFAILFPRPPPPPPNDWTTLAIDRQA